MSQISKHGYNMAELAEVYLLHINQLEAKYTQWQEQGKTGSVLDFVLWVQRELETELGTPGKDGKTLLEWRQVVHEAKQKTKENREIVEFYLH